MCGIFGFLSGREGPEQRAAGPGKPVPDGFFRAVAALTDFGAEPSRLRIQEISADDRAAVGELLDGAQAESYFFTGREGFLASLADPALAGRLRQAAAAVSAWSARLDACAERGGLGSQADREFLNRLIVGGKDIAWRIEKDVLAAHAGLLTLLGSETAGSQPEATLAHAWELDLALTNVNRLEVRGRDSAGLAVYVRFPSSQALEAFLDGGNGDGARRHELDRRSRLPSLTHGAIVRPSTAEAVLLQVFKTASEVGKMGDNAAFLRDAIARDGFFQDALRVPGVEVQCLAHTRWASNGIISLANCHPVDSAVRVRGGGERGRGEVIGVLNGDVDNYQELLDRYIRRPGLEIDEAITTDAKIIPVVVAHHYAETGDLVAAFRRAFAEFEGSMAIGVMAADRPGEFVFGQKGSGQGLFLGLKGGAAVSRPQAVAIASEMYGLVELTPRYVKAEGERVEGGEVFHLRAGDGVAVRVESGGAAGPLPASRVRAAEITTRDINRGDRPHFFLKEIGESVDSVRKTLRGKFETAGGEVRFLLGPDVLSAELIEALRSGKIRRIIVTGQGTAAVAAEGIAHLLEDALARASPAFQIAALKATELSGHHLRDDMADTLVIAVSQSGTTTDTNRTVDMAKERGARILGIVNRRNSDLVYKSHGVLYTSDGRDIEMSVASTKAFYAQNVAGAVLALALASELGTLEAAEIAAAAADLERLPEALRRALDLEPEVARLASELALKRRHWALVGTGAGKIAANEIRIKLSELCYKSIAIDFFEDKKHIDLSSEPLILACANGLPPATVSDIVKEVAIFKAHKSIPIVIADEGESRFDPYARGVIRVPRAGRLSFLCAAAVGHLFGYHAAAAFDARAERLRRVRAEVLAALGRSEAEEGLAPLPAPVTETVLALEGELAAGDLDGGLNAGTAAKLWRAFEALLGRLSLETFRRGRAGWADALLGHLSEAIAELSRPIDAIKHQAKTVTVGISRGEAPVAEGVLLATFRGFGLALDELAEPHRRFLAAFEPLVSSVEGATLYRVAGLDPLGRPAEGSTIRTLRKTGCAAEILSRSEEERPLAGTKWGVVKQGRIYLGYGKVDSRKVLMVPAVGEHPEGHLLLYHLELVPRGRREARLKALRARPEHLEKLKIAVTERNAAWSEELIDAADNDLLFFDPPDAAAEAILERCGMLKP
jgi:glucosamine--fructose-6-phosphate aminotransferase (isomerizing)